MSNSTHYEFSVFSNGDPLDRVAKTTVVKSEDLRRGAEEAMRRAEPYEKAVIGVTKVTRANIDVVDFISPKTMGGDECIQQLIDADEAMSAAREAADEVWV